MSSEQDYIVNSELAGPSGTISSTAPPAGIIGTTGRGTPVPEKEVVVDSYVGTIDPKLVAVDAVNAAGVAAKTSEAKGKGKARPPPSDYSAFTKSFDPFSKSSAVFYLLFCSVSSLRWLPS